MIPHKVPEGWTFDETLRTWTSPSGRVYGPIEGGCPMTWVTVIVVVIAAAVSTYATMSAQESAAQAATAQAQADQDRAQLEAELAQIEAKAIQERANWERQATLEAAEFEADMAIENARRDQAIALELADLENASAEQIAEFEARTARELAELEAEATRQQGGFESREARRRASIILAKRRALAGLAGVELTSGSPLMAELDAVRQMEIESLGISHAAEMGALITSRRGELQSQLIKERQSQAGETLKKKIQVQGRGALDEAEDVGTAARYEASLRTVALESMAAQQSWSRLLTGRVRQSEAMFSAEMNRFNARVNRQQKTWTLIKGVTQVAAAGAAAYAGGTTGGVTNWNTVGTNFSTYMSRR